MKFLCSLMCAIAVATVCYGEKLLDVESPYTRHVEHLEFLNYQGQVAAIVHLDQGYQVLLETGLAYDEEHMKQFADNVSTYVHAGQEVLFSPNMRIPMLTPLFASFLPMDVAGETATMPADLVDETKSILPTFVSLECVYPSWFSCRREGFVTLSDGTQWKVHRGQSVAAHWNEGDRLLISKVEGCPEILTLVNIDAPRDFIIDGNEKDIRSIFVVADVED